MRIRTHHGRRTRKLFGRHLPTVDLKLLLLCNRFAASSEGRNTALPGTRWKMFRTAFYALKERILEAYGRPCGLAEQSWESKQYDWNGYDDYERCSHIHILERVRIGGKTLHRPTGHFSFYNQESEYYKESVGFDEVRKGCVEKLSGLKRVEKNVPDKEAALSALSRLRKRYRRLPPATPRDRPRVRTGSYFEDRYCRERGEEVARAANSSVQCHFCLVTKPALVMAMIDGHDICGECRQKIVLR